MPETMQTVRRRLLGAELRRHREAAGFTLEEAGAGIERTESTMSRLENGRNAVRPLDVRLLLDVYGVTDPATRDRLSSLARNGRKKGWWQPYADLLSPAYSDLISLEDDAAGVRTFEMCLVPGLLQTEDYSRAVIEADRVNADREEIETFVKVRMERQHVLTREETPLQVRAILSEAALHQRMGGPDVMRGQLHSLGEAARLPNVTLQVLPFAAGAHAGVAGPYVLLTFPEPASLEVVLLENMTNTLYLEEDEEVIRYGQAFERLCALALHPARSTDLIAKVASEL